MPGAQNEVKNLSILILRLVNHQRSVYGVVLGHNSQMTFKRTIIYDRFRFDINAN